MQRQAQVFVQQALCTLSHLPKPIVFVTCINCQCPNPIFPIRAFQILLELTETSLNELMQQDTAGEMCLYFFSTFQPNSFKFQQQ